jgi:sarcosine oxidase subunit beta
MSVRDVAIIGGGIMGCSAALHLRQRGVSVVLVERGACGAQASGVNYGGVRRQGRAIEELPIAARSREIWSRLPELIGTDGEFVVSGHLKLARSESEMDDLGDFARNTDFDLDLQIIPAADLHMKFPWLSNAVVGGSFCPGDGHANPRLVSPAFARAASAAGAEVLEYNKVEAVEHGAGEFQLALAGGQTIRSTILINAAGAWGARIAAQFDEYVPDGVMAPNMAVTEPVPFFMKPNLGVCGGNIYARQIDRGNVIFGGGTGIADRDNFRSRPLCEVTATAARDLLELVPQLASANVIRTWSGIEGVMPDSLPILGESAAQPGLFHAFGFSGHGFQMGPAVGAILAELIVDGRSSTSIAPFSISRFSGEFAQRTKEGESATQLFSNGAHP